MTLAKLVLFDTTLRDGELSPNFNPTASERFEIAKALERAGVDVIELTSTTEQAEQQQSSKHIAKSLKNATVCCLSPMSPLDVEIANGIRQLEGTINGVGPAGGNTDLVDVVQVLTPMARQNGIEFDADVNRLLSLSNEPYFSDG